MATRREYTFSFIEETCLLACHPLYVKNWKELDELRDYKPSEYRKILRLCWLRSVGLSFKHIPSNKLTTVSSVDDSIKKHDFING